MQTLVADGARRGSSNWPRAGRWRGWLKRINRRLPVESVATAEASGARASSVAGSERRRGDASRQHRSDANADSSKKESDDDRKTRGNRHRRIPRDRRGHRRGGWPRTGCTSSPSRGTPTSSSRSATRSAAEGGSAEPVVCDIADAKALGRRDRTDRREARPARRAGEQRRHHQGRADPPHGRRGFRRGDQHESQERVRRHPRRRPADDAVQDRRGSSTSAPSPASRATRGRPTTPPARPG